MGSLGFSAARLSPRAAEHEIESVNMTKPGEFGSSKAPLSDEPPAERGRFREFWAARPMLSVAAMFVAPIAALLLFMALA